MRLLNDIKIAKEILIKEDLALVVVKNGEIVYKSKDKGIKPLLEAHSGCRQRRGSVPA